MVHEQAIDTIIDVKRNQAHGQDSLFGACAEPGDTAFSVVIPSSPFLRQRMAGLSGVARDVIMADLTGARKIYIVSSRSEPTDWRRSFAVRGRPLPDVTFVDDLAKIAMAEGERLVVLPADRLPARQTATIGLSFGSSLARPARSLSGTRVAPLM